MAILTRLSDEDLLKALIAEAEGRLSNIELISTGERFLLAKARHSRIKRTVLIMLARPDFVDRAKQLSFISEMLSACAGAGLGEVVDRYWPADDRTGWGALALTWRDSARTLLDFVVKGPGPHDVDVLEGYRSVVAQVAAMHDAGYVHGDISMSNILVTSGGMFLSDFEYVTNGKYLDNGKAFFTSQFSPPARLAALRSGRYSLGDAKAWDRFALGRVGLQILAHANPYQHKSLTLYNQRALRLISGLLMGKYATSHDVAVGLPIEFYAENGYDGLEDATSALDRLTRRSSMDYLVPELSAVPSSVVEIGLNHPVAFTKRVRRLIETPQMQDLAGCQQLGLVSFIWPTATHTRLQHAIGTFGMSCAAVANLYADPQSPLFRVLVSASTARSFLAAALLHDVGHYPLAHDLEEAFPGEFDHEPRSVEFIEQTSIADILRDEGPNGWNVNPADVASIVQGTPRPGSTLSRSLIDMLHSVLSGALDVDKLDYLVRDSRALGVAAGGGLDIPRVLSSLTIALVPNASARGPEVALRLAIRAKGVRPAELVGRVRSHMFGVAYWHHSYRAIKAMIHWLVWSAVAPGDSDHESIGRHASAVAHSLFDALDHGSEESQPTLPGLEAPRVKTEQRAPALLTTPIQSRMPSAEAALLKFLADLGDSRSEEIIRQLGTRSWYRSVLTVEHFKNIAATRDETDERPERIWTWIDRLKAVGAARQVVIRKGICLEFQELLYQWFDEHVEEPDTTQILDWENVRHKFMARSAEWQLVLVDLVETRKSHDKPLYFVVSERPGSRLADPSRALKVRRSYDQQQLQDEFIVSNGAIRVLIHPEFEKLVSDSIGEDELLGMLESAVDIALTRNGIARPRKRRSARTQG